MKKFVCIILVFTLSAVLFACSPKEASDTTAESTTEPSALINDALSETVTVISGIDIDPETEQYLCSVPTVNRGEAQTKPVYVVPEGLSGSQQIHWPIIPVKGVDIFQAAACAEMSKNPKFNGAQIIKDQYLQLGEINGEPCVRVHLDTDKGDFVAVMTEDCEILSVWVEGDEKTVEYYFPQAIDVNVATDEALMQAFNVFHEDEHYAKEIICGYRQEMADFTDGSTAHKIVLIATGGDFTVLIDEFGRVISRTK